MKDKQRTQAADKEGREKRKRVDDKKERSKNWIKWAWEHWETKWEKVKDQKDIALMSDSVVATGQLTDKEEKQLSQIGLSYTRHPVI